MVLWSIMARVRRVLIQTYRWEQDIISEHGHGMILVVFGQRQTLAPQTSLVLLPQQGLQQQPSAIIKSISHGVKEPTRTIQEFSGKQGTIR